jgi:hypothetical protein
MCLFVRFRSLKTYKNHEYRSVMDWLIIDPNGNLVNGFKYQTNHTCRIPQGLT